MKRLLIHNIDDTKDRKFDILFSKLNELKKEGKEVYQIFIDAGICHTTISSLVNAVNSHWDKCNSWWYGEKVQNARTIFCNRHLRISNKTTLELKRLIVDNLH